MNRRLCLVCSSARSGQKRNMQHRAKQGEPRCHPSSDLQKLQIAFSAILDFLLTCSIFSSQPKFYTCYTYHSCFLDSGVVEEHFPVLVTTKSPYKALQVYKGQQALAVAECFVLFCFSIPKWTECINFFSAISIWHFLCCQFCFVLIYHVNYFCVGKHNIARLPTWPKTGLSHIFAAAYKTKS